MFWTLSVSANLYRSVSYFLSFSYYLRKLVNSTAIEDFSVFFAVSDCYNCCDFWAAIIDDAWVLPSYDLVVDIYADSSLYLFLKLFLSYSKFFWSWFAVFYTSSFSFLSIINLLYKSLFSALSFEPNWAASLSCFFNKSFIASSSEILYFNTPFSSSNFFLSS